MNKFILLVFACLLVLCEISSNMASDNQNELTQLEEELKEVQNEFNDLMGVKDEVNYDEILLSELEDLFEDNEDSDFSFFVDISEIDYENVDFEDYKVEFERRKRPIRTQEPTYEPKIAFYIADLALYLSFGFFLISIVLFAQEYIQKTVSEEPINNNEKKEIVKSV